MRSSKGFLLLEVVVSIAVIAGGLLFVVRSYSTTKKVIDSAGELSVITLLLEEKLFDGAARGESRDRSTQGDFPGVKGYVWASDVVTTSVSGVDLAEVKMRVSRSVPSSSRAGQTFQEEVVTYLRKK